METELFRRENCLLNHSTRTIQNVFAVRFDNNLCSASGYACQKLPNCRLSSRM